MANFVRSFSSITMKPITLCFSSCPNDTFMFYHFLQDYPDCIYKIADIKTLNEWAEQNIADVTKLSVYKAGFLTENYEILSTGAAIGFNNGPLVISKRKIYPDEIPHIKLGIPGKSTTAYLLLNLFYSLHQEPKEYFFNEIEEAILDNEIDAGLIIHETRFTYEKKGLKKIVDLGELWYQQYQLPLPLGVIAVKRNLTIEMKQTIYETLKNSIIKAQQNPQATYSFVKKYAQELDDNIITKHIQLYVNSLSVEMGLEGKNSILTLFRKAHDKKLVPEINNKLFFE